MDIVHVKRHWEVIERGKVLGRFKTVRLAMDFIAQCEAAEHKDCEPEPEEETLFEDAT